MCVYYADLLGSIDFKRRCTEWSVWHQSTTDKRADGSYDFEWLSRYFDVIHWPFCAVPLKVERAYWHDWEQKWEVSGLGCVQVKNTKGVFDFMQCHENRSLAELKQCMPVRKLQLEPAPTPRHWQVWHQMVSLIFLLTIPHRFSMGFRSGEFAGQSSTVTPWSLNQGILPGLKRRRTGLLPSGPKPLFRWEQVLHLI